MKTLKKAFAAVGALADGAIIITEESVIGVTTIIQMGTDEIIGARLDQRSDHGAEWCDAVDAERAKFGTRS